MEIILQERVSNLGRIGDLVNVKAGYARNFLIPYGKAVRASDENRALVEAKRTDLEAKEAKDLGGAQARADKLAEIAHISIMVRASAEGKLYGSVGAAEIADALAEKGFDIAKKEILLKESIRELGDHDVAIRFHIDLTVSFPVTLMTEEKEGDSDSDSDFSGEYVDMDMEEYFGVDATDLPETNTQEDDSTES